MDLAAYLRIFRERWVTIVVCLLLGVNAAIAIDTFTTPVYAATASLFLKVSANTGSLYDTSQFSVQRVKSYTDLVDSPNVLGPVIDELKLGMTVDQLAPDVSAANPVDTATLQITAVSSNAHAAATIANAVSKHLSQEVGSLESANGAKSPLVQLTVTVPASTPLSPESPKSSLNVGFGFLTGGVIGLLLAIVMSVLDHRIRTADDIRRASGLLLLGQLPRGRRGWRRLLDRHSDEDTASAYADVISNLRRLPNSGVPDFLVLAPASGLQGSDPTRLGLAQALAESGRNVCVVETDVRGGPALPFPPSQVNGGLAELLDKKGSIDEALKWTAPRQLAILPSGTVEPTTPPPTTRAVTALMDELRSQFDSCIAQSTFRSKPVELGVLAPKADAVVIVARFARTRREELSRLVSRLEAINVQPIGVLLIAVPTGRRVNVSDDWESEDVLELRSRRMNLGNPILTHQISSPKKGADRELSQRTS
jgi:Capsular polysaccharide biosynthesis protein